MSEKSPTRGLESYPLAVQPERLGVFRPSAGERAVIWAISMSASRSFATFSDRPS
jgi:hypothetical protein